jgi:hypothetical protein
MACGKTKDLSVKPQNLVGKFKRTQCPFFRQTVHESLRMGHFSAVGVLMHRVIHRNWGPHIGALTYKTQVNIALGTNDRNG